MEVHMVHLINVTSFPDNSVNDPHYQLIRIIAVMRHLCSASMVQNILDVMLS